MAKLGKKKKSVIDVLNKARSMELQAIGQYMNQHYGLDDMDYGELAAKMKLIAIDEMRHAEMFAERIKELGGEPTTDPCCGVDKGQEVKAIYDYDSNAEDKTIEAYNEFLAVCRENSDNMSMQMFETIIEEEQVHLNYFDNIKTHISSLGAAFLAQKAGTPSTTGLNTQGFVAREAAQ
ncbi:MAG: bacterioferritin [Planctomycetes bacterium]|nr:bacterioferritin [Planctomycetota bacterium]